MKSRLDPEFRRLFAQLPQKIQERARAAYRRFIENPAHPSLSFKRVHPKFPLWSVRVTDNYRAVGVRKSADEIIWFFIGTHAEYDRLLETFG